MYECNKNAQISHWRHEETTILYLLNFCSGHKLIGFPQENLAIERFPETLNFVKFHFYVREAASKNNHSFLLPSQEGFIALPTKFWLP